MKEKNMGMTRKELDEGLKKNEYTKEKKERGGIKATVCGRTKGG